MWNPFRRRTPELQAPRAQALAMVLLPDTAAPDLRAAISRLQSEWRDTPSVLDVDDGPEPALTAQIPGGMLALLHMPVPIPPGDLEGPAMLAWHWRGAGEAARAHRSHVIVHATSTALDMLDLRLLHTRLVALVVAAAGGTGVYVGDAMLLKSPDEYVSDARSASRDQLPILLWIGFNPVSDAGRVSAYTTGMASFGLLEMEARRSARPAPEVLGRLAEAANYELSTGAVLEDGDTFGSSATERRRVRHTTSEFMPGTRVALLDL